MKKILLYLCVLLLLFTNTFAFNIYNSQNKEQTYFSLNENRIFLQSASNSSFNISYKIFNETKYKTYIPTICENFYCINFHLSDLIESEQGTFVSSNSFEITQNDKTKTVYLDLESPKIQITNHTLNTEKKQITIQYNYSDDSGKIAKIDFYKKQDNNLNFIKEISQQNSVTHNITEAKTYTFIFRIYDAAGNFKEKEHSIKINDIFEPKINKAFIINNNGNFHLEFELSDENLTKYEITQNSITLSENIAQKQTYTKTISIPFTTGEITLKAIDGQGNHKSLTLSLKTPITHTYKNKYSSSKTFEFKSNADTCLLSSVNSEQYNEKIDRTSDTFRIKLNINTIKEYTLRYYCEKSNYRQYFTSAFFYDTNPPTKPEIKSETLENGFIKLSWSESEDAESSVSYILYRNSKKIYDGSKKTFEDNECSYPNTYEYYIEAYDEAGNKQQSNEISSTPKKIKIAFETTIQDNLRTQQDEINFNFNTDKNSNIIINVKNNNEIIDSHNIKNTTTTNQNFKLKLAPGINQIEIKIDDNLNNQLSKTYFITYSEPIQQETIQNEIIAEPQPEKEKTITAENQTTEEQPKITNKSNNWIWFIILIILFSYFLWFFIFNEEKRKKSLSFTPPNKNNKNKKISKIPKINFVLSKDKRLEKDFNRIKKERIARQEERKKEEIREKKLNIKNTKTTQLQKEKLEDLKNRREINIPLGARIKSKTIHKKIRKEPLYEEELKSTKEQTPKTHFWQKQKEPKKIDAFSEYIKKVKSAPSWNSQKDYIHKEPQPETPQEPQPKPQKTIQPENENNQKQNMHNQQPDNPNHIKKEKLDLDSYLNKRKKSRRFFLAERSVNKDINNRK
jgi:hypothetical protein